MKGKTKVKFKTEPSKPEYKWVMKPHWKVKKKINPSNL